MKKSHRSDFVCEDSTILVRSNQRDAIHRVSVTIRWESSPEPVSLYTGRSIRECQNDSVAVRAHSYDQSFLRQWHQRRNKGSNDRIRTCEERAIRERNNVPEWFMVGYKAPPVASLVRSEKRRPFLADGLQMPTN